MPEQVLIRTFLGKEEEDKINAFLNKECNIEDEEESDYEEASITIQKRRDGKQERKKYFVSTYPK